MQWSDEALILGLRKHGETAIVLEVLTCDHGRHFGLVHGGRSKRWQPVLQPGNRIQVVWRARLDDHLGVFRIEPVASRAAQIMESSFALHAMATMAALLRLLPERDPHPGLFHQADALAATLHREEAPADFVRFEVSLLAELGFGLNLTACAMTGGSNDLLYVSPRTGRAVGRMAGEEYKDRLLELPPFLAYSVPPASPADIKAGFALTGFFLRRIFHDAQKPLPTERDRMLEVVSRLR